MVILKSENFTLRPYRRGDEESIVENINNKQISRYMSTVPFPYKLKDAKYWVNHNLILDKSRNKKEINFLMFIFMQ